MRENIKTLRNGFVFVLLFMALLTFVGPSMAYTQTNLVSNISGLANVEDVNVVNSWGIAHLPTGPWWVADNGMGVSTVYNGSGVPFPIGNPLVVTIPGLDNNTATPTGIVANNESEFNVTTGNPAKFIFVTEDGTISAWNPNVDPTGAVIKVNNSPDAVYKGVTISEDVNGTAFLYAANFRQGRIDVFDTDFNPVTMDSDAFVDSQLPAGYAPFNIQSVDGNLVVTFAQPDSAKHDEIDGPGLGYVDTFDPDGKLIMRLEHGNWLNSPWGVAMASANFGNFSNDLLIGNFGSGQISAFNDSGKFQGFLNNESNQPIVIDGLWGLGFGNDANAGSSDTLFFAAGLNGEQDGLFGNIAVSEVIPIPPPKGKTWNVDVGGQTQDMAIQGMAFYPGVITVNVGDTIKWNVKGNFHTISFLSGQTPPPGGSPESLTPSGGSEYNGTGFLSSGILPTGGNYSLTFTEAGIFDYSCLIHLGMQGVVIVQPNGSKYPFTQTQYRNQGRRDLNADLNVGRRLASQVMRMTKSSPGPNNSKSWQTFIDIPSSETVNVRLNQVNFSHVRGSATLNVTGPDDLNVQLKVSGLEPNSAHVANIKIGNCDTPGSTVFTIGNFAADSNGRASLVTDINVTPPFAIMNRGWIVDIDGNTDENTESVACGNVIKHDAARMRFAKGVLTINQGDTVTWTQLNSMEIHTVSFLADNQTSPELLLPGFVINPEVAAPAGTENYNGTGFSNSGILPPGASYSLTFTEPGTFKYECLIHDEMNMVGYIKVNTKRR